MDYYANDYAANQYLASRGFIVLSVNYRLGIGYGHAFQFPVGAGQRGASEYLDVLAAAKFLQARPDVDAKRLGIWGGSYGGYLTALALGRNSDIFAAGVDIHGVHNWERQERAAPNLSPALAGDGITQANVEKVARVTYESSPVSSVATWKSPVLLIHPTTTVTSSSIRRWISSSGCWRKASAWKTSSSPTTSTISCCGKAGGR
jgi:dipeptidyl aminopeptidase/acylaminoacyl peptidase